MNSQWVTTDTHTQLIDPAGTSKTVSIDCTRITKVQRKGRKKLPPESYFLLGFDTEYQTIDPIDVRQVRSGQLQARNQILSYQYSIKKVTNDPNQDGQQVSGIIIPPSNGDRLHLKQFIAFAIGDWINSFPKIMVPRDVYLIGHFTRADLPAFDQFAETARKLTSNIRNTFVSIDSSISLFIEDEKNQVTDNFLVRMRDTLLLAPTNAKSLADIGEIVGLSKISLAATPQQELHIKQNMAELRQNNWPLFHKYAIRDAEVCVLYAEKMIRQQQALLSEFKLPIILTSFGTKLVLQGWKDNNIDRNDVLGRETYKSQSFSKKLGYSIKTEKRPYIKKVNDLITFVTETYHGGRNEQFWYGIAPQGNWRDLDLSSAYTTAMSIIGRPNWKEIHPISNIDHLNLDDLAFFDVRFSFPKDIRFPVLPVRTEHGLIFPRKGLSHCSAPELWLAKQLGCKIQVEQGWMVETNKQQPVFLDFIKQSIEKRAMYQKGSFENLFWKEVGNSTYGKTAQGMRRKRVYDLRDDRMVELPESDLTQPFFASFITSYTRAVLGEIVNALPPEALVFSVTTDGFLTTATEHDISKAIARPISSSFKKARKQLVGDDNILEAKHSVKQPVGWRTRGSCTLIADPGDQGIVLQKGGIKTAYDISRQIENDYIVDLFFNRTADSVIEQTMGLGIRDMVAFESDFVTHRMEKTLRMEFDWKRLPLNPSQVTVDHNGRNYSHLSFDTRPWQNIDHFSKMRERWDNYNRKKKFCLKTKQDLKDFIDFGQQQSNPASVRRYLSTKDGDLRRLARDISRAVKSNAAGFEILPKHSPLRIHRVFIELCNQCGIPVSVKTLDYAKRCKFVAHQSIGSTRAIRAATAFRDNHFPALKLDQLFPLGD